MASRSSKRITIDVDGTPRRVISISERRRGDVFLIQKANARFNPIKSHEGTPIAAQAGKLIIEDRMSVHPSFDSELDLNVLKHTLAFEDGESFSNVQYTHALKVGAGAVFLFTKRYPNLRDPMHRIAGGDAENISLGAYDPSEFSLVASGFVVHPGYQLGPMDGYFFSASEIPAGPYKLIVLWSYLSWRSPIDAYRITRAVVPGDGPVNYRDLGVPPRHLPDFFAIQVEEVRRKFSATYRIPPQLLFYVKEPSRQTEAFALAARGQVAEEQLVRVARLIGMPLDLLDFRSFWKRKDNTSA